MFTFINSFPLNFYTQIPKLPKTAHRKEIRFKERPNGSGQTTGRLSNPQLEFTLSLKHHWQHGKQDDCRAKKDGDIAW